MPVPRLLCVLLLAAAWSVPAPVSAQPLADTLFTWQGYARTAHCRLQLFQTPPDDERRTHTFVLQEVADNPGPSTLADARYLAEQVGRHYGIDPAAAYFVFHWGAFSYAEDGGRGKELFLRATFSRTRTRKLGTPHWRVVTREDVEAYTDRRFR